MKEEFNHKPKHYILTRTLIRKNARRRMLGRFHTKQACIDYIMQHYQPGFKYDIYTYNWKLIESVDINKYIKKGGDQDAPEHYGIHG